MYSTSSYSFDIHMITIFECMRSRLCSHLHLNFARSSRFPFSITIHKSICYFLESNMRLMWCIYPCCGFANTHVPWFYCLFCNHLNVIQKMQTGGGWCWSGQKKKTIQNKLIKIKEMIFSIPMIFHTWQRNEVINCN